MWYNRMIASADCLALLLGGLLRLMRRFEHLRSLSRQPMKAFGLKIMPSVEHKHNVRSFL